MNTFRLYMTKQDHIATYVIMYYIINHQEILITYKEFEKLYIYIFYIIDICIIYNNIQIIYNINNEYDNIICYANFTIYEYSLSIINRIQYCIDMYKLY